jgi:chorismate mutase
VKWQMRAIRGATTVAENSIEAIRESVTELLDQLEQRNKLQPEDMIDQGFRCYFPSSDRS